MAKANWLSSIAVMSLRNYRGNFRRKQENVNLTLSKLQKIKKCLSNVIILSEIASYFLVGIRQKSWRNDKAALIIFSCSHTISVSVCISQRVLEQGLANRLCGKLNASRSHEMIVKIKQKWRAAGMKIKIRLRFAFRSPRELSAVKDGNSLAGKSNP